MTKHKRRVLVCAVSCLGMGAIPLRAQICTSPPLFDLSGPGCSAARQAAQCGCSECITWDATSNATWYEIKRCDQAGANCTIVGDTKWRNRGATHPTLWCAPWDDPFPLLRGSYQYSIRACLDGPSGPLCSLQFSSPVAYVAAPYMCIENGVEVTCSTSTPPPSGFANDYDQDGILDTVDPDDDNDQILDGVDNCILGINVGQRDTDKDGVGDACDLQPLIAASGPADADADGIGDAVDDCPSVYDPWQTDADLDRIGDACDNCPDAFNEMQTDTDDDGQGDHCDLDDGTVYAVWSSRSQLTWTRELGDTSWCVYRGDLAELRSSGKYTQSPGSNALVGRYCDLAAAALPDATNPAPGATSFYLAGGRPGSYSTELGSDSAGVIRPNTNPCP